MFELSSERWISFLLEVEEESPFQVETLANAKAGTQEGTKHLTAKME